MKMQTSKTKINADDTVKRDTERFIRIITINILIKDVMSAIATRQIMRRGRYNPFLLRRFPLI